MTDDNGVYQITGVSQLPMDMSSGLIQAHFNDQASLQQTAPKADGVTVDLVLLPTSSISGNIGVSPRGGNYMMIEATPVASSTALSFVGVVDKTGWFELDRIPIGDYEVTIVGQPMIQKFVTVVAGQPALVSF